MTRQTEAIGMLKITAWWRSITEQMDMISREEASAEATDEFVSEVMGNLIAEITKLLSPDDDQVETTIVYKHASGKNITFTFSAQITED